MGSGSGEPSQVMVTLSRQRPVTYLLCLSPSPVPGEGLGPVHLIVAPVCRLPRAVLRPTWDPSRGLCLLPAALLLSILSILSPPLILPLVPLPDEGD